MRKSYPGVTIFFSGCEQFVGEIGPHIFFIREPKTWSTIIQRAKLSSMKKTFLFLLFIVSILCIEKEDRKFFTHWANANRNCFLPISAVCQDLST